MARRQAKIAALLGGFLVAALPVPAAVAEPPDQTAPALNLRSGEHEGFSRLVFDWDAPVTYSIEETPSGATVSFDRPARLDLKSYRKDPSPGILDLTLGPGDDGLTVALRLPEGANLRHFLSGPKVVIDVLAPGAGAAEAQADQESAAAGAAPESLGNSILSDAVEAAVALTGDTRANRAGTRPTRLGVAPKAAEPKAPPRRAAPRPATSSKASRRKLVVTYERPPLPAAMPVPGMTAPRYRPLAIRLKGIAGVAAAAFRRGQHLWLVFDLPARVNIARQIQRIAPELAPVLQLERPDIVALRLTVPLGVAPKLRRDGTDWLVDLRPRLIRPEKPATLDLRAGHDGPRLVFPVTGAGRLIQLDDPDMGDRVHVLPVSLADFGLATARDFPQFQALATYQGLAIVPRSDRLWITLDKDALKITSSAGLLVTAGLDTDAEPNEEETVAGKRRLFDLAAWREVDGDDFETNRKLLQRAIIAPGDARSLDLARLRLARFFFAHGLATETLSVIRLMARERGRFAADPEMILLEGAAAFLAQDFHAAAASLSHPALEGEAEAVIWRAAMSAAAQDWPYAAELFEQGKATIQDYPRAVRVRLHLLAAEARLAIGDTGGASFYLKQALEAQSTDFERAQIDFLEGRRLLADQRPERALPLWRRVAASTHRPSQARARLALVNQGLKAGTLEPASAIAELERLRFVWRGDEFEAALLERLGRLYADAGDYRDALVALRQAASHFPGSVRAEAAARHMRKLFASLYLGDKRASLSPLAALALYREFEELTPAAQDGNRLIDNLVDRLVEIDLLGQAAELLEDQIARRLAGEKRARAGARLALVRLLDRQPGHALEALNSSAAKKLPSAVERQRRHLRARALAGLHRGRDGLAVLAGDESEDARKLRAEILWQLRDWPAAAVALARLIPRDPPKERALDAVETQTVIDLATAYTLAGDRRALDDLARRFGKAMAESGKADSFTLLTSDFGKANLAAVADELAGVERIQAFIASYRARVRKDGLSNLN